MKHEKNMLQIIYLPDGRWKYDITSELDDDQIIILLERLQFIEKELKARMKTVIVPMTETVEFITEKQ